MTKVYVHCDVQDRFDNTVLKKAIKEDIIDILLVAATTQDVDLMEALEDELDHTFGSTMSIVLMSLTYNQPDAEVVKRLWDSGKGFGALTEDCTIGIGFTKEEASAQYAEVVSDGEKWEE